MTFRSETDCLWLITIAGAAAFHVVANANRPPNRRDLPVAQDVANRCGAVLANQEIRILIEEVAIPASFTIIDRDGARFQRPFDELEAWSSSFFPEQWDTSKLKVDLEAALQRFE